MNNLSVRSELTHPYHVLVEGKLESITDIPKWQASISSAEVSLQAYLPEVPITLKNINLSGSGDFSRYAVDGNATVMHSEYGEWDGKWSVEKSETQWNIQSLQLTNNQTDTTISVNGGITTGYDFTAATAVALHANWQNLQWPPKDSAMVASKNGTLEVSGSLNDYLLHTTGMVQWSDKDISNIDINAQGSPAKLQFSNISADLLDGHIQGSGSLFLDENVSWQADTNLSSVNLSGLYPDLNTKLKSHVTIEGGYKDDKVNSVFAISDLSGSVNKHPVAGKARLALDGELLKVTGLQLRSGKSRLRGAFDYKPGDSAQTAYLKANWDVHLDELNMFAAQFGGTLTSTGSVSGAIDELSGKAALDASNVVFEKNKIHTVKLNAQFDLTEKTKSHVALSLQQAVVSGIAAESLQLTLAGTGPRHTIDAKITQDADNFLALSASGSWVDNKWNVNIDQTQIQSKQFGHWRQTKPATVAVSTEYFAVGPYCLSGEKQGSICGSVQAEHFEKWQGDLAVKQIPLAMFKEFLPPQFNSTNVDLEGRGKFSYAEDTGALLDFKASGQNGIISGIMVENKETPITFNQFNFELSNVNRKLEGKTSITIEDTGTIALELSFPNWSELSMPDNNQHVLGHVKIDLKNLTVLTIVSDYIKDPVGQWHSDIAIGGTLEAPVLIGESHLKASSLTLTKLGLTLREVDLTANSNEKRAVNITGSAKSGAGSININGSFQDYRAKDNIGSIKITGENFELARIPEATIIVSPNLNVSLKQNSVAMTGDILISEADFKIFTPTKTIVPSPDVVIVSAAQPEKPPPPINLTSKIRIILGKKVKVQGYGFTSRLEGSVLVDDTHAVTTASGEINILDGKYAAYGTTLDIARGSLSFSGGSIDNPLVNVRAERRPADNVVVGVLVQGNVQSPEISLFSEPPMQDSDILSYIILGQPLNAASEKDGKLLTNAAASLGLLGGEKLAKEIGKKFGIDEIKIQSDQTTKDTSLLLGKYLSPDFYVGYAIGIGNAVDTLQIQYKLTDQWMLKTQSGEEQKAEILFTIEKD